MLTLKTDLSNDELRIYEFLKRYSGLFIPPLTSRVNILDYANKLSIHATNIFLVANSCDIGHAAVYLNRRENSAAFLSSLCVAPLYWGKKASDKLLTEVISICQKSGIAELQLEVAIENWSASQLYVRHKFSEKARYQDVIIMSRSLD